jgi:hypothetical protein
MILMMMHTCNVCAQTKPSIADDAPEASSSSSSSSSSDSGSSSSKVKIVDLVRTSYY